MLVIFYSIPFLLLFFLLLLLVFFFFFCIFDSGFVLLLWLAWNSLCNEGWSESQKGDCLIAVVGGNCEQPTEDADGQSRGLCKMHSQ